MQPLLSVIIPVYNVEKYLRRCLDSVTNQSYNNLEIILVDDGSPDNSGSICDEYAKKDPRIKVVHQENAGLSGARNSGISIAKGDFITFVDSDDWIDKDMYSQMLQCQKNNDLDIVCSDTYLVKFSKIEFRPLFESDLVFNTQEALNLILSGKIDNAAWNKIYRNSVFVDIRYPLRRIYEDVATTYKVFAKAAKIGYLKKPFYYYFLKNPNSLIATSFNVKSRYDAFVGYKERYEYAKANCKHDVVGVCYKFMIKHALSTLTAMYGSGVILENLKYQNIKFVIIDSQKSVYSNKLELKYKILLWSFLHCKSIHKIYAYLSGVTKKIKNIIYKKMADE